MDILPIPHPLRVGLYKAMEPLAWVRPDLVFMLLTEIARVERETGTFWLLLYTNEPSWLVNEYDPANWAKLELPT